MESSSSLSSTNMMASSDSFSSDQIVSEASSSSEFLSFETFVETASFDITTTEYSTVVLDFSEDTTLDQVEIVAGVSPEKTVIMGMAVKPDISTLPAQGCVNQGYYPLLSLQMYIECVPVAGTGFRPMYRSCPTGYVFDMFAGACIHASAKNVLRSDLGFRLGPGPNSSPIVRGEQPFVELSQFSGISPICSNPGSNAFGNDDRFFLSCSAVGAQGTSSFFNMRVLSVFSKNVPFYIF